MSAHILGPGLGLTGLVTKLNPTTATLPPGSPQLWFTAQNIDGNNNASLVDGQQIGTWVNLGSFGAGGNLVQATAGLRPTFKLLGTSGKINNKSAALFTPTQWMQTATVTTMAQPNTVCMVANPATSSGTVTDGNNSTNRNDTLLSSTQWQLFAGTALYNSTLAATASVYHVLQSLFNGTSSFVRANKVNSTPGTSPGTQGLTGLSIGVAGDATTPFSGQIVEVIVYGAGTAPSQSSIDAYFDSVYGSGWPQ